MFESISETYSISQLIMILRKHWFHIIMVFLVSLGCSCTLMLYEASDYANCVISMNYSGIEKGQNPNGTRFSMNSIISNEVLSKALEYAGLTDMTSVNEISKYIRINSMTASTSSSDYYYSTSYNVVYSPPQKFSDRMGVGAADMLKLLCKAYKDVFYAKYTENYDMIKNEVVDADVLDYEEAWAYYNLKANQLNHFLTIRMDQNDSFVSEAGDTFRSLQQRVYNLINYEIANFSSFIWENGVVADYDHYVSTLDYKNFVINQNYQKEYESYLVQMKIIDEYDNAMTGVVLVPSYDTTSEFYMSRTKIGIDYLALNSGSSLRSAQQYRSKMETNNSHLLKLTKESSASVMERVDKMSVNIADTLKELTRRIEVMDEEYTRAKTRNYFVFRLNNRVLMDKIDLSDAFVFAFVMMVAMVYLYYVSLKDSDEKGGRKLSE